MNPIKKIRTWTGLNQEDFAHKIGEKQSAISRWENGANITWGKVMKITEMLNFPKTELFS